MSTVTSIRRHSVPMRRKSGLPRSLSDRITRIENAVNKLVDADIRKREERDTPEDPMLRVWLNDQRHSQKSVDDFEELSCRIEVLEDFVEENFE